MPPGLLLPGSVSVLGAGDQDHIGAIILLPAIRFADHVLSVCVQSEPLLAVTLGMRVLFTVLGNGRKLQECCQEQVKLIGRAMSRLALTQCFKGRAEGQNVQI